LANFFQEQRSGTVTNPNPVHVSPKENPMSSIAKKLVAVVTIATFSAVALAGPAVADPGREREQQRNIWCC